MSKTSSMPQTDHRPLADAPQYCPTLTLRKLDDEGALLVDVREPGEIASLAFDVGGIIHMPLTEFERRHAELPRDRLLILACAVGERSLKATHFLMYRGYTQVANLEGGLTQWLRKGFPVRGDAALVAAGSAGHMQSKSESVRGCCQGASGCVRSRPRARACRQSLHRRAWW